MDLDSFEGMEIKDILAQAIFEESADVFEHEALTQRIRRTLYYHPQKHPDKDTLSFSATESAVSSFRNAAPMPIRKLGHRYASRVARDACVSPCALLLGLIYIERMKHRNPSYLKNVSSSDLFLISMMVASKYLYDEGSEDEVYNDEWAASGEMEVEKVNKLEADFLTAIDWNLYVHPQEFSAMLNITEADIALSNGYKRGWLSYSDLRSLLDGRNMSNLITQAAGTLSKATYLCMIMYSGLVCMAAFSTVALHSMTRLSTGPSLRAPHHGNASDPSDIPDSPVLNPDLDEAANIEIKLSEFEANLILPPLKIATNDAVQTRNARKLPPEIFQEHSDPLARETTQNHPDMTTTRPPPAADDPQPPFRNVKQNACALLNAVFFMAHIPRVCDPQATKFNPVTAYANETEGQCEKCGKQPPPCHRWNSMERSTAHSRNEFRLEKGNKHQIPNHKPRWNDPIMQGGHHLPTGPLSPPSTTSVKFLSTMKIPIDVH